MSAISLFHSLGRLAARFCRDKRGNVAMIFAIVSLPAMGLVGAAVDYSRAVNAKSSLQAALDTTALMISKDAPTLSPTQIQARAQQYFNALYTGHPELPISGITAVYTPNTGNGSTIVVNANGAMNTDFLKVLGSNYSQIPITSSSTTTWGNTKLRVALVLDNTGSMAQDGKISALRTAASNLVDTLSASATNPGDVLISLIPFAKDVNVGSSNYSQNWIDWSDWQADPTSQSSLISQQYPVNLPSNWAKVGPGSNCPFGGGNGYYFGCTSTPTNGSSATSTIPSSGSYNGYICPGADSILHKFYNGCWNSTQASSSTCNGSSCSCASGAYCSCTGSGSGKSCTTKTFNHSWIANNTSTWTGCVNDRTQPYDTTSTAPTLTNTPTLFPADQLYENSATYCATNNNPPLQQLTPLTYNWTTLKSNINAMQPTGGTNQAIGLAWGWLSLLQTAPLSAPSEDSNYTYNRVIILLSDGLNTEDRWPGYGNGSSQSFSCGSSTYGCIDARQLQLCNNIKAVIDPQTKKAAYTIYTIQVNTGNPADPTSAILQSCASDSSKFSVLTSSNQIISTFNSIGTALSQLRISK